MKIANLIEDGRLAGPQRRIVNVASALSGKFDYVVLIPKLDNAEFKGLLEKKRIKYSELPIHRLTLNRNLLFKFMTLFIYEVMVLRRYLIDNDIDLIHVSGGSWQWKGIIAGRMKGCRVIWHLNDTNMNWIVKRVFKYLVHRTDGLIVAGDKVTETYVKILDRQYKGTITTIPAPVDPEAFHPDRVKKTAELDVSNKSIIVTVANISPVKDLKTLIRAAAKLQDLNADIIWYVAGPIYATQQHYKVELDALIEELSVENIRFLGACENIPGLLKLAQVYVCTSMAEASPTSVWEAMCMGLPIVSTDVGDVSHHVVTERNGFVVPVGDAQGIAESVKKLIADNELRTCYGSASRNRALDCFTIESVVEKHEQVYSLHV